MVTKIGFFGECMVELSSLNDGSNHLKQAFGGDSLNTAVYLSRLSSLNPNRKLEVFYISALGIDTLSDHLLTQWQAEGINTEFVKRDAVKIPGLYKIETDALGERSFNFWRNDSAAKHFFRDDGEVIFERAMANLDAIYISGISFAILEDHDKKTLLACLTRFKAKGGKVYFDNNYRASLWSIQTAQYWHDKILSITDIAFITLDDDQIIFEESSLAEFETRMKKYELAECVVKRGKDACLIYQSKHSVTVPRYSAAALVVDSVVDTTAAGDSFSAGYLSERLLGHNIEQSAKTAHKVAACVIGESGAIVNKNYFNQTISNINVS